MRHTQNRRSRGRSRKAPNPLARNYESNGPDVKIRGTAVHVAEKYSSLARDALAAGDTVSAENYLQHAEHYNRLVAAAQQAQYQQTQQQAQQRDGAGDGRDDEFSPKAPGGDGSREQKDEQPEISADGLKEADETGTAEAQSPDDASADAKAPSRSRRRRGPRAAADDGPAPHAAGEGEDGGTAAEAKPSGPNGRQRKPSTERATNDAAPVDADGEATSDGAAALSAFPD